MPFYRDWIGVFSPPIVSPHELVQICLIFHLYLFPFRGITYIFILNVFYRDWSGVFSPPIVLPHELANSTEDFSLSSTSPTKGKYL